MWNVQNSYAISAANPAELAGIATSRFVNGQQAIVGAMRTNSGPGVYTLQGLTSNNPDNFFVIPTFDDPLRQWVYEALLNQSYYTFVSAEIDLTKAPQSIIILPPLSLTTFGLTRFNWAITAKDGTVTTGPTAQAGSNAAVTNFFVNGVQTALAAGALNASVVPTGLTTSTVSNLDLTANGIVLQITAPAVLGTATVFKARILSSTGSFSR